MIISYKEEHGRVVKRIVHKHSRLRGEPAPDHHFSQTLLKAHYALEIEQGSRYRSSYPKSVTKRVLERSMQRDGAL